MQKNNDKKWIARTIEINLIYLLNYLSSFFLITQKIRIVLYNSFNLGTPFLLVFKFSLFLWSFNAFYINKNVRQHTKYLEKFLMVGSLVNPYAKRRRKKPISWGHVRERRGGGPLVRNFRFIYFFLRTGRGWGVAQNVTDMSATYRFIFLTASVTN